MHTDAHTYFTCALALSEIAYNVEEERFALTHPARKSRERDLNFDMEEQS